MRILLASVSVLMVVTPVWAGGMGDPSTVLRQKNAICDQQRRGEIPPGPSFCLPELPVGPVYEQPQRRR